MTAHKGCPTADAILAGQEFTQWDKPMYMIVSAISARVKAGDGYLKYGIEGWWEPTTYSALVSWAAGCTTHNIRIAEGYKFLTVSWTRKF